MKRMFGGFHFTKTGCLKLNLAKEEENTHKKMEKLRF